MLHIKYNPEATIMSSYLKKETIYIGGKQMQSVFPLHVVFAHELAHYKLHHSRGITSVIHLLIMLSCNKALKINHKLPKKIRAFPFMLSVRWEKAAWEYAVQNYSLQEYIPEINKLLMLQLPFKNKTYLIKE